MSLILDFPLYKNTTQHLKKTRYVRVSGLDTSNNYDRSLAFSVLITKEVGEADLTS